MHRTYIFRYKIKILFFQITHKKEKVLDLFCPKCPSPKKHSITARIVKI